MAFRSQDYIFRQTALGQALEKIGLGNGSQVRDIAVEGVLRERGDRWNEKPSQVQIIHPV